MQILWFDKIGRIYAKRVGLNQETDEDRWQKMCAFIEIPGSSSGTLGKSLTINKSTVWPVPKY